MSKTVEEVPDSRELMFPGTGSLLPHNDRRTFQGSSA